MRIRKQIWRKGKKGEGRRGGRRKEELARQTEAEREGRRGRGRQSKRRQ